jgi:hypothetical protein
VFQIIQSVLIKTYFHITKFCCEVSEELKPYIFYNLIPKSGILAIKTYHVFIFINSRNIRVSKYIGNLLIE